MTRLVVLLAIFLLLWVGIRRVVAAFLGSPQGRQIRALWRLFGGMGSAPVGGPQRPTTAGPTARQVRLVKCAVCGTHVPEDRALRSARGSEEVYCSPECMAVAGRT